MSNHSLGKQDLFYDVSLLDGFFKERAGVGCEMPTLTSNLD